MTRGQTTKEIIVKVSCRPVFMFTGKEGRVMVNIILSFYSRESRLAALTLTVNLRKSIACFFYFRTCAKEATFCCGREPK